MSRSAPRILSLPSFSTTLLAMDAYWVSTLVHKNLRDIYNCYVAELAEDSKPIQRLGSNGSLYCLPPAVIDHFTE